MRSLRKTHGHFQGKHHGHSRIFLDHLVLFVLESWIMMIIVTVKSRVYNSSDVDWCCFTSGYDHWKQTWQNDPLLYSHHYFLHVECFWTKPRAMAESDGQAIPCNLGEWQMWDIGRKEWYTNKAGQLLLDVALVAVGVPIRTRSSSGNTNYRCNLLFKWSN